MNNISTTAHDELAGNPLITGRSDISHAADPHRSEPRHIVASPAFDRIQPAHADAAIDSLIAQYRDAINAATSSELPPDWTNFVVPLEEADDALSRAWAPVSHLNMVCSSDEWRGAHDANLAKLTDFHSETGQNPDLYRRWQALHRRADDLGLDATQRKIVDDALRDFRLAGVDLDAAEQKRFRQLSSDLSALQTRFEQNVMDCTDAWHLDISDRGRLDGMSDAAIAAAASSAARAAIDGWRLALDFPTYYAVMSRAHDRELRKTLYHAYCTRSSDTGPHDSEQDNSPVIADILALRHELANLLGFDNYAERALVTRMAASPTAVIEFLQQLASRARPAAEVEARTLQEFSVEHGGPEKLEPWDISYWSERLKQSSYGISSDMLRPWFPLPSVLAGMFAVATRCYGFTVIEQADVPVWHSDVTTYDLFVDEVRIGRFYLDPYARKGKRGGAWMDEFVGRKRHGDDLQLPVATLVCNFAAPAADGPSLLSHDEVTTLFHEFGHGLHHLLTQVDYPAVSGIRGVPWDAVELPSQFNENWCWERESLDLFARHHETGDVLPDDLFNQLKESRRFQAGLATLRQIELALFDFRLHHEYAGAGSPSDTQPVIELMREVHDEIAIFPSPDFNRYPHSFGHIFAGGYAAGYYSYKWAEVLAADAFEMFREHGIFDAECGQRFRDTILARGGSIEAGALYRRFRGRDPKPDALLIQDGLLNDAA